MKILVVQDYLRSGGTERQTILLTRGFAEAGHATTLITFRPGGALAAGVDRRVETKALQPFDTRLDWFAPGLSSMIAKHTPDIVLCMGRMANGYAGFLQNSLPTTVISTMRTGKSLPWLFRRSLRQSRHVIANSHAAMRTLAGRYEIPQEKIAVIHNSLVFPPAGEITRDESLRNSQGAGPDTLVCLSVAMFRPEKNQRELIEILAQLPPELDWQLWLAGDGPARAACEKLARSKRSAHRIKFLGWHRNPASLYGAADVAVHTSRSESLSNFLIEAQAHGVPAVAYDAQGIDECFVPGETGGVVAPGDRTSFRSALLQLTSGSNAECAARSARARAHARSTFDPDRQIAAHLWLFQNLIAAPGLDRIADFKRKDR